MVEFVITKIAKTDGRISHVGGVGWWHDAWKVRQHSKHSKGQVVYRSGEHGGPIVEIVEEGDDKYHLRSAPDQSRKNNLEELAVVPAPWPNPF